MFKTRSFKYGFGTKSTSGGFQGSDSSQSSRPRSGSNNNNSFRRFGAPSGKPQFFSRPVNSNGGGRGGRFVKAKRGESIDVAKFISKSDAPVVSKPISITHRFSDFALSPELKKNLEKRKYDTPTPIQDQSIEPILNGRDLIGLANTGTGKTAAFLLPLIDKVFKNRSERVLIIAPTRELAQQVEAEFRQFSWDMRIFSCACVGGLPIHKQISMLHRNTSFVIGTPGRLKDLSDRGVIDYSKFGTIVLDEVDRMLDMGFVDEITMILSKLPADRQSLFFSATLSPRIKTLIGSFVKDPVLIEVKTGDTAANVDQNVVRFRREEDKFDELKKLLSQENFEKTLIFSETKRDVEKLTENLNKEGFRADSIHGDKKQSQRQRALNGFKNNVSNILVATDVAARGLDIDDVTHVINYTIPQTYDDYIHRIGRTGRCNKKGTALTFVYTK